MYVIRPTFEQWTLMQELNYKIWLNQDFIHLSLHTFKTDLDVADCLYRQQIVGKESFSSAEVFLVSDI